MKKIASLAIGIMFGGIFCILAIFLGGIYKNDLDMRYYNAGAVLGASISFMMHIRVI